MVRVVQGHLLKILIVTFILLCFEKQGCFSSNFTWEIILLGLIPLKQLSFNPCSGNAMHVERFSVS